MSRRSGTNHWNSRGEQLFVARDQRQIVCDGGRRDDAVGKIRNCRPRDSGNRLANEDVDRKHFKWTFGLSHQIKEISMNRRIDPPLLSKIEKLNQSNRRDANRAVRSSKRSQGLCCRRRESLRIREQPNDRVRIGKHINHRVESSGSSRGKFDQDSRRTRSISSAVTGRPRPAKSPQAFRRFRTGGSRDAAGPVCPCGGSDSTNSKTRFWSSAESLRMCSRIAS